MFDFIQFTDVQILIFILVMVLIVIDIITGFSKAVKSGNVSSTKMREGLWHKLALIFLMLLGVILHFAVIFVDIGVVIPSIEMVAVYIIIMEIISILENIKELNPDLSGNPLFKIFDSKDKSE